MKGGTRFNYPKPTLHKRNKEQIKLFGQTHALNQEKKKWLGKTKNIHNEHTTQELTS